MAGLPCILDVGQCNDAYSAIRIALGLAEAFDCSVNELPLSIILCWFEQKAVCVLMALLALGIRGIRLGPTLPAFLSPGWPLFCRRSMTSGPSPRRRRILPPVWAGTEPEKAYYFLLCVSVFHKKNRRRVPTFGAAVT